MITIEEFCRLHNACIDGRGWALAECKSMQEVWEKARPEWLVWVATREGVLDNRTLRLFACWCARQVWHLLNDERSRIVVEVAEKYANGSATDDELAAAYAAASTVASAASAAACSVACASACAATCAATWDAQAEWLRGKADPCFERKG